MRGGKRDGAGRKPRHEPKKAVTVRLEPKIYDKLTKLRHANKRSESGQIEDRLEGGRCVRVCGQVGEGDGCWREMDAQPGVDHLGACRAFRVEGWREGGGQAHHPDLYPGR